MAAASPVLRAVLSSAGEEDTVLLQGFSAADLDSLLSLAYTGRAAFGSREEGEAFMRTVQRALGVEKVRCNLQEEKKGVCNP